MNTAYLDPPVVHMVPNLFYLSVYIYTPIFI